ncbi:MAG: baseplate J/gp47 family protein [Butyrivibrio sp.]|nr:baseplate J/gp47 family protein [Butyrivibrio sp.]
MLSVDELKSRTYKERIQDVMSELPIRSSEWTNYNPSDPGITILEDLTAYSTMQGDEIVTLSYRAKMALLKMAGFIPARAKCAKVLLSANLNSPVTLKNGEKFHLGNMCFETNKETTVGSCRLLGVFSKDENGFRDISFVIDNDIRVPAKVFGDKCSVGSSIYFIIDHNPQLFREVIFYFKMADNRGRNPTKDRTEHIFADITWECYTDAGFVGINARDFTGAFVNSGEVRLSMPRESMLEYDGAPVKGYCIRATLMRSDYDIIPKMINLYSFLFEVWQKDTKAFSQSFNKNDRIQITSPLGSDVYYQVFAKEKKGPSFRKYETVNGVAPKGRYCTAKETNPGTMTFTFSEEEFGYGPKKSKECVRVIIYNEEIMRQYKVGKVIGYDDQEIELPVKNIVNETFFLIAERKDEEGFYYDFVRPEKKNYGDLYYHLLEGEGKIIIEDPGDYIDADLFMGSVAVMDGDKGNIIEGCKLTIDNPAIPAVFYNPAAGTGGGYRENLDRLKERFLKDMKTPYRAVTADDYEYIVKTTPGLCIRKAKAVLANSDNTVKVVVLPESDEKFPKLPGIYIDKITDRLSDRRLLATKFAIVKPCFVPIGVKCTAYVKRHYASAEKQIEESIRNQIDYLKSDRNFGEKLRFEDVFSAIEELDCVDHIYNLTLHSENGKLATAKEYDIYPRYDVLCYPGDIQLEIVTSDK